jgi:hypothetical protein
MVDPGPLSASDATVGVRHGPAREQRCSTCTTRKEARAGERVVALVCT